MYKEIFIKTFDSIFNNINRLIKKLFIPAFVIVLLDAIVSTQYVTNIMLNLKNRIFVQSELFIIFAILFIYLMSNISLAVITHRFIVLKEDFLPSYGSYIFSKREFKFLFTIFKFSLTIIIPSIIFSFIPVIGPVLSGIFALIITMRLSLVFPAVSCDEKMSLKESWYLTKNHNLLMFVMLIVFPSIFTFSVSFVYSLVIAFLVNVVSNYFTIFYSFLNIFIAVFMISALSNIYLYINNRPINKIKNEEGEPEEVEHILSEGIHKISIDTRYNIDFNQLKKELFEQYKKLDFTHIVYDRKNSWILKKDSKDESYISLRNEGDKYIINVKNGDAPILNCLKKTIK